MIGPPEEPFMVPRNCSGVVVDGSVRLAPQDDLVQRSFSVLRTEWQASVLFAESKFVANFFQDLLSVRPLLTALGEPIADEICGFESLLNALELARLAIVVG